MKKIKYGILSTASIVPRFVQGVEESEWGMVEAIASRNIANAKKMAVELGIPKSYGSYQELCEDPVIDVVYIATYNKGHYEAALLALNHSKNVLLEKPFCLTSNQTKELFAIAKAKKCFIMEAQKAVFLPATLKVKELIQENTIGKIHYIDAVSSHLGVDRIKWFHSLEDGGGALYGSGTYPLEYIQYIMDQTFDEGTGTSIMKSGESDRQCHLSLKLGEETLVSILISTLVPLESGITFYGENGSIHVPNYWKASEFSLVQTNKQNRIYTFSKNSEFSYEVNHVNECIAKNNDQSPIMTEKLTLNTIRFIESMYQQWSK